MWLPQANWCIKQFLSYGREIPNESIYLCNTVFIDIFIQHPEAAHDTVSNFPYLFLNRPTGELVDGQIFARIPPLENLFYWSFDAFGRERLDSNWADEVLPQVVWETASCGPSWTSSQYQCLREVHKARGFDPDGPDVAISMGYPLLTPYNNESYFEEYDDEMDEAV
ncbi:hypothetical protein B0H13DRAFT_2056604 [Mycena leptocephala]|nr:hypothetical protein B0H13DRAFT_2056604 [Mycena leptocephala]